MGFANSGMSPHTSHGETHGSGMAGPMHWLASGVSS